MFVGMALFDSCALIAWEWLATQREWMRGRWVPRLLALTVGIVMTGLAIYFILDNRDPSGEYRVLCLLVMAGMYSGYRYKIPDLFMLAGGALSVIVVTITWLANMFLRGGRETTSVYLLLGLFSMLATAAAAWWLRQLARKLKDKLPAEVHEETTP
jgi:uncharacterized membrane protein